MEEFGRKEQEEIVYIATIYAVSLNGGNINAFNEEYEKAENKVDFCIKKWQEIRNGLDA